MHQSNRSSSRKPWDLPAPCASLHAHIFSTIFCTTITSFLQTAIITVYLHLIRAYYKICYAVAADKGHLPVEDGLSSGRMHAQSVSA